MLRAQVPEVERFDYQISGPQGVIVQRRSNARVTERRGALHLHMVTQDGSQLKANLRGQQVLVVNDLLGPGQALAKITFIQQ